ncbi:hypothetical protein K474DRAFT_1680872, partial [Panus rudis PR-1116 ss-1]
GVNGHFHVLDQQADEIGGDLCDKVEALDSKLDDLSTSGERTLTEVRDTRTTLDMKLNTLSTLGERTRKDIRDISTKTGDVSTLQDNILREVRNLDDRLANLFSLGVNNHRDVQADLRCVKADLRDVKTDLRIVLDGQVIKLVRDKVNVIGQEVRRVLARRVMSRKMILMAVLGVMVLRIVSRMRGGDHVAAQDPLREAGLSGNRIRSETYIKEFYA